ncbi:ALQxL family class IV lanthipeptide [Streptomyces diastatochromogenes]|nr:ALQxL family class IV lanthipeptide [Streptomyces diastatochromogenes]
MTREALAEGLRSAARWTAERQEALPSTLPGCTSAARAPPGRCSTPPAPWATPLSRTGPSRWPSNCPSTAPIRTSATAWRLRSRATALLAHHRRPALPGPRRRGSGRTARRGAAHPEGSSGRCRRTTAPRSPEPGTTASRTAWPGSAPSCCSRPGPPATDGSSTWQARRGHAHGRRRGGPAGALWPVDRARHLSDSPELARHWCSGSSGIGTFLVRLWEATGASDEALRDLVDGAALAVRAGRATDSPATCHGLAGNAEFLLDAAVRTGDERHFAAAGLLVEHLAAQAVLRDGRLLVPDENRRTVLAEYATGLAGSLSLLLRLRGGGPRAWLPEDGPVHLSVRRPQAAGDPPKNPKNQKKETAMMEFDIDALQVLPEEVRTEDARGEEHAAALITACRWLTSGC